MKLTSGSKVAITLAAMTLALFAFRLYFRAFVYEGMYIAPEDPYGIADVIELMLVFFVVLLVSYPSLHRLAASW